MGALLSPWKSMNVGARSVAGGGTPEYVLSSAPENVLIRAPEDVLGSAPEDVLVRTPEDVLRLPQHARREDNLPGLDNAAGNRRLPHRTARLQDAGGRQVQAAG